MLAATKRTRTRRFRLKGLKLSTCLFNRGMLEKLKIYGRDHHAGWIYANQIQPFWVVRK
jgi:hypothetical protein